MGGRSRPSESLKTTEQPTEKKKGFADWMNIIKPGNEEKDHWVCWNSWDGIILIVHFLLKWPWYCCKFVFAYMHCESMEWVCSIVGFFYCSYAY